MKDWILIKRMSYNTVKYIKIKALYYSKKKVI